MIRGMGVYQRNGQWWYRRRVKGQLHRWSLAKLGIATEAQARAYEREMTKARLEDHLAKLDPSRVTLESFTRQYLEERTPHVAPKSLARYRTSLTVLARDLGGNCLLRSLTARKLANWAGRRLAQGVTPAGVNADLRHIRSALNTAARWSLVEKAPFVEMVKEPRLLPRHLTPSQVETLLKAETNFDRRRLWLFLIWTGMRRLEAHGLHWEHIAWGEAPSARVVGKGRRERLVPLLPEAVVALGEPKDLGPVWPQVHLDTWTHWFEDTARAAGVSARLHDLRHTAATWMIARGVPVRVVQEVLGHAQITTTERYSKAYIGDLYQALSQGLVSQK